MEALEKRIAVLEGQVQAQPLDLAWKFLIVAMKKDVNSPTLGKVTDNDHEICERVLKFMAKNQITLKQAEKILVLIYQTLRIEGYYERLWQETNPEI